MASWLAGIATVEALCDDEPMVGDVECLDAVPALDCLLHLDDQPRPLLMRFTSLGYYSFPAYVTLRPSPRRLCMRQANQF